MQTRHSVRALTWALAAGLACGRTPTPPPVLSIAFTYPDTPTLNTADNTDPTAPQGSIGITVTGLATGVSVGSAVRLTVDSSAPLQATIQSNLGVSFPHVYLSGSAGGTAHALFMSVVDSGGAGSADAGISVTVLSSSGCEVTLSPGGGDGGPDSGLPASTLFNESGGVVVGFTVVQDTDLTTPGMQANLTVTGNGASCTDGTPVSLKVGSNTPLTGNLAGGMLVFTAVTLPDTPLAALTDGNQRLSVSAQASGGAASIAQYVVDSIVPTAVVTLPQAGASFGDAQDVDSNVPGLQINVSGTTLGFGPQLDAGYQIAFQIVDSSGNVYDTPLGTPHLAADGSFATEITLPNGTPSLIFQATGVTGNVTRSAPVQVTVSATPVIFITRPMAGIVLNNASNQVSGAPQMNTTVNMTTTAAAASTVDVCSTIAPSSGAVACMNAAVTVQAWEVGQVQANGPNTSLFPAILADGQQTLYAAVNNVASPGITIIVHTARPQITGVTIEGSFDAGGNTWLNQSNLDGGTAWAIVDVTLGTNDVFALPDGGSPSSLFIANTANAAMSFSAVVNSQQTPPAASVPVSLPDGPYGLQITVTDPYGNSNDLVAMPNPADFNLLVKATLPGCDITSPLGPYYNVADNGGVENAGNVNLPVKLATTNVTALDVNGSTVAGQATVSVDAVPGTPVAVTTPIVQAPTPAAQGPRILTAQVVDPAGNPPQACINSVPLTVATVNPTLVITALNPDGTDGGIPFYNGRDAGISIASTDAEMNQPVTVFVTIASQTVQFASVPLTPPTTTTTLSNLPSGLEYVTATVTDLAGNTGTTADGGTPIQINASGCSLVVTTPSTNPAFFNGTGATGGVASPPISFFTPDCDGGTVTLFNTLDGGSTASSSLTTSSTDGTVTFHLQVHDGDQGSFYASIANGQTTPTVFYQAKFTGPIVGGITPDAGSVWVVAQTGNPNAGSTIDGGVLVLANQFADQTQALTDFQLTGLSNLGPVDSANHIGSVTLTTSFTTQSSTYGPFLLNAGQTSVDFPNSLLPPHDNGTVTVTVQDSAQNTTTESWAVLTDVIPPGAPQLTASTKDPRAASFNLAWTATADDDVSGAPGSNTPVSGYALGWSSTVNPVSDVQFGQMTLDPGAAALPGNAVGFSQSYVLTGLPTFNSFFLELRAVDSVGNRSALTPASSVATISDGGIPNTLHVATISGPGGVRFGYRLANGDFNSDGMQDLAIAETNPGGTGTVYLVPGNADLTKWDQAIGLIPGVQSVTSGADAGDLFGYALAVGDFNGDGIDDLAVGAPLFNNAQGLVEVFFGTNTGLPATPSVTIQGNTTNQGTGQRNFGSMVASVGPVGGGVGSALQIGAPYDGTSGTSYLFLGRSLANWATINSYTQADTTFTSNANDGLGYRYGAVPLGDINNDGSPDFTVPASPAASVYLVEGGTLTSGTQSLVAAGGSLGVLTEDAVCDQGGATFGSCFGGTALGNVPLATGGASLIVAESALNRFYIFDFTPTNLNPTPVIIAPPSMVGTSAYMGWAMVQSDINGDGHPDLLLGTQNNVSPTGIFYYVNSGASPYFVQDPNANLVQSTASYFGFAIAAGSFNGGAPDVAGSDPFGLSDVWIYY
jgi:hypothetical protein